MSAKFELKKSKDGQFMFNLKAANGEVILTSELYKEKSSAENGVASVKANAAADANYERKTASNGEPFFVLKAANKQIIGKSELYSSQPAMERGIDSVKKNGPTAVLQDHATT